MNSGWEFSRKTDLNNHIQLAIRRGCSKLQALNSFTLTSTDTYFNADFLIWA